MDLTNIVYNFTEDKVASQLESVWYDIPVVTNMAAIKTGLDLKAGFDVARAVVQYKGNLDGPRVVMTDGNEDPDQEQTAMPLMSSLTANLTTELADARVEVEAEITSQIE